MCYALVVSSKELSKAVFTEAGQLNNKADVETHHVCFSHSNCCRKLTCLSLAAKAQLLVDMTLQLRAPEKRLASLWLSKSLSIQIMSLFAVVAFFSHHKP